MKTAVLAFFAIVCCVFPSVAALAAPKVSFEHSTVRLFQAGYDGKAWQAGLEILLPGEWKTYWRVPGDAGIPPEFDWSGSSNLAGVEVAWPAPARYHDEAGESIGYKHQVVFPLTVRPIDASMPVHLKLDLFYAVCDDICIPGKAAVDLELSFSSSSPSDIALSDRFTAKVPVRHHPDISIQHVSAQMSADKPALLVAIKGIDAPDHTDIFVDGLDGAYFRKPVVSKTTSDETSYLLVVDGTSALDDLKGKPLEVVVTHGDVALAREVLIE